MKKSNLFKRVLAYTLVLAIVFSQIVFTSTVSAAEKISVWDGTKAESFAGGDGTATSPFLIETAEQLYKMVVDYSTYDASYGKYFKITKDIYLNNVVDGTSIKDLYYKKNWLEGYGDTIATASKTNSFYGTLEGNGNTVYGLYIEGVKSAGLFPAIASYTVIKNLNLNNVLITGGSGNGGAFAGQAIYYTWQSAAQIKNCSLVNATVGQWGNLENAGGFIGCTNDCGVTITECYAYDISLSDWKTPGAFIGHAWSGGTIKINNSYSVGYFPTRSNVSKAVCTNVYTDTAIPEGNTTAGVTVLTADQMKGEAAKTNMSGLDFVWIWETVENNYPVTRENPVYVWDGTKSSVYAGGTGTASDPYLIDEASQLAYVVSTDLPDGKYYKLIKDIRINDTTKENWKETAKNWAWADIRFVGKFDGDGHTIDGLFTNGSQKRFGLFSYVGDSLIENFRITNASVTTSTGEEGTGIVSCQASAKADYRNIYIDENSEVSAPNSKGVAGIVSRSNQNINISNCAVLAKFEGKSHVGAFYGTIWGGTQTLNNCYTASNVPTMVARALQNSANNYATVADLYGTTVLTADQMKGEAAKTNMPALDYVCVWETVENDYPILRKNVINGWDGTKAESFAGGDGTATSPFLIENGGQLYKMVAEYSTASVSSKPEIQTYFKLIKDINLSGKQWYVTGSTGYPSASNYKTGFNGIIYGEGHTIYGLYSNKASGMVGLIPTVTQGAEIYDLHLESGNLPKAAWNTYAIGGLIGLAAGASSSKPIIIDNCSVKDFTIASRDASAAFIGLLYSQSVVMNNCYSLNVAVSHTNASDTKINSGAFIGVTDGNDWENSIVIKNSYSDTTSPLMYANDAFKAITTYENVYTANETYDNSIAGLTKLTVAQMTGVAAKENLKGFNFNQIWQYGAEGEYPTHKTEDVKAMYWNGTAAESFAGGEGTIENPYEVSNAQELYLLANADTKSTAGKYFELTNDIEISDTYAGWENENPYSWTKKTTYLDGFAYSNSFAGTLNGNGYTVSGLYYEDVIDNGNYAYGLIPFVTANAVIKNLNVENVAGNVTGEAYVGAVVGAVHVTAEDAVNALKKVQIVGVNVTNSNVALLGGATRGVKFELCNAETLIGIENENISVRNCNGNVKYNDNVIIYNTLNADSTMLVTLRNNFLGENNFYITDINGDSTFDARDIVSAKKALTMEEPVEILVWSDDFDGDSLNYSVWSTNTNSMSKGSTLEYADNSTVNDGTLTLSCKDTGKTNDNGDTIYSVNYGLDTANKMSFKYGRLEMRAKIPFGAGAFPSLWLSSRNAIGYDSSSEFSTEVDIFEVFGKTKNNDTLVTCLHKWYNDENGVKTGDECSSGTGWLDGNNKVPESQRSHVIEGDAQNEFHTFVFEWDEDSMSFSVDGDVYYTASRSDMDGFDLNGYNTNSDGIFNQPLYILINNQMYTTGEGAAYTYGVEETDSADDIDASKLNYEIDYIRLYQKNDGKSEINFK